MYSSVVTVALGSLALAAGMGAAWQARETTALRREISGLGDTGQDLERMRAEQRQLRALLEARAKKGKSPAGAASALPRRAEMSVAPAFVTPTLRAEVEERYAAFFTRLSLAAEVRQAVAGSIAARYASLAEQSRAATRAGQSLHDAELLERTYATQVRLGAQLEAEFGPRVAEAYRQFEWELAARNIVVIATKRLASTPTPLSEEQRQRLFALLLQHAGPGLPGDVTLGDFLPPHSQSIEITERIVQAAAPWLLPAQLAMLETFRTSQWKMAR